MSRSFSILDSIDRHPSGVRVAEYVRWISSELSSPIVAASLKQYNESDFSPKIAISGSGLMGCSVAAAFLACDVSVGVFDVSADALASFRRRVSVELSLQSDRSPTEIAATLDARLKTTSELADLADYSVIVETIPEKLKIKQKHYQKLDEVVAPGTLLLSNTSTIEIGRLATILNDDRRALTAERFCGFHFFHPVRRRSLVEVIRGAKTSDRSIAQAVLLARTIRKTPIVVGDGPGFLVNRLLQAWLNESLELLTEGVPMNRIETACRRFGTEMGPFRIMDEIGLDVVLHGGWTFFQAFPDRATASELLPAMIQSGRLGRKNGRGFYRYESQETQWLDSPQEDSDFAAFLDEIRRKETSFRRRETVPNFANAEIHEEAILGRILVRILEEALRIVEDGIVDSFEKIDQALVLGLGFPAKKGGLCFWIDSVSPSRFWEVVKTSVPNAVETRSLVQKRLERAVLDDSFFVCNDRFLNSLISEVRNE